MILVVANFVLLSYVIYFLPFHRRNVNIIVASTLGGSSILALIAYFSTLADTTGPKAIIAAFALLLPSAGLGKYCLQIC